jgi:hypothetical protein
MYVEMIHIIFDIDNVTLWHVNRVDRGSLRLSSSTDIILRRYFE